MRASLDSTGDYGRRRRARPLPIPVVQNATVSDYRKRNDLPTMLLSHTMAGQEAGDGGETPPLKRPHVQRPPMAISSMQHKAITARGSAAYAGGTALLGLTTPPSLWNPRRLHPRVTHARR